MREYRPATGRDGVDSPAAGLPARPRTAHLALTAREQNVADVLAVVVTVIVFAVLALCAKGAGKL
jgi:hypothetical protein